MNQKRATTMAFIIGAGGILLGFAAAVYAPDIAPAKPTEGSEYPLWAVIMVLSVLFAVITGVLPKLGDLIKNSKWGRKE